MRNSLNIRSNLEDFVQFQENRFREYDESKGVNTWLDQDKALLLEKLNEKYNEMQDSILWNQREILLLKLADLANRCFMLRDKINEKENPKN